MAGDILKLMLARNAPAGGAGTISFIGSAVNGGTTLTLPTHQANDLLLMWCFRSGNNSAPALPANWTQISTAGTNSCSFRLAYQIAPGAGTASGTWTSASHLICQVYRPSAGNLTIGINGTGPGAIDSAIIYPAVTLQTTDGSSWVAGFAGNRTADSTLEVAPTNMTARSTVVTSSESSGHDTNAGVASWTQQTVNVGGTAAAWQSSVVEIKIGP